MYKNVKVKSEKKNALRIGGVISKFPSADGSLLPIITGCIVRHIRIAAKVSGTLTNATIPYTAAKVRLR